MTDFALHLLRHGEPERTGLMLGRTDCASTAAGIAACVDQAGDLGIETLISSDLIRASHAASAIGRTLNISVTRDPRWRELDFGAWDGMASADLDPEALGRFWNDPDAHPPPGGERWSALVARVSDAIAMLPPRPTLIVTHGGAMRAALAALCGFDQRQLWAFELPYAALLSLRVWEGQPRSAQITGLYA
ncbi:histidine phosphatase family protein [Sphingobium boeckii]|uniref:Alpha-ribazole phosphatase n=1 Tax=Sphingobium boeckii TaxID=1082345 RepID=A0A7W9AJ92_9SPHN|nr:histidine phosphatase family protein [Sphingobium boeckii]MBB5686501.1 alpha-ribazole phosphatase [Sphingobium boeckii]